MIRPIYYGKQLLPTTIPNLPEEIWVKIVFYILDTSFIDFINFGCLSKRCFNVCIQYTSMRMNNIIGRILPSSHSIELKSVKKSLRDHSLMVIDSLGRYYHIAIREDGQTKGLYIFDSKKNNLIILDLWVLNLTQEELKLFKNINEANEKPENVDDQFALKHLFFTHCYPIDGGFITASVKGIATWKFSADINNERPQLTGFISFEKTFAQKKNFFNRFAGYFEGQYFFSTDNQKNTDNRMYVFDVALQKVYEIKGCNSFDNFFGSFGGKLCFFDNFKIQEIKLNWGSKRSNEIESKTMDFIGEPLLFPECVHEPIKLDKEWSVYVSAKTHLIYIVRDMEIWIDPSKLRLVRLDFWSGDRLFLVNDFLFLCYRYGDIRIIDLPLKRECNTQKIKRWINEKLGGTSYWVLYSLKINEDKEVELIIQTRTSDLTLSLDSFTISFERLLPFLLETESTDDTLKQKTENKKANDRVNGTAQISNLVQIEIEEVGLQPPLETPVVPSTSSEDENVLPYNDNVGISEIIYDVDIQGANTTIYKVILVVGAVFFALSIIASSLLIVWHPGKVVFVGGGLRLTLPAVLTLSIGCGNSLILIAIGSYRWWASGH